MSASQALNDPPDDVESPRPVVYDPADPFWHDTEDDDDDMDYLPAPEDNADEEEEEEEDDDDELHFHDATESLGGAEIVLEIAEEVNDEDTADDVEGETGQQNPRGRTIFTPQQLMQLLGHGGFGRILAANYTSRGLRRLVQDDEEDDDFDDSDAGTGYDPVGPRRRNRQHVAFEPVPSEQGRELMNSGTFGSNRRPEGTIKRKKRLAYDLMRRELGLGSEGRQRNTNRVLRQDMIPESTADTIIHYNARCYSGQFSDDGNFFFSCAQDFRVRMYDTSNPYNWRYYKSVVYHYGQWTITDATLSPDNRFLAYSSIRSIVCLAPTDPDNDTDPNLLDFANIGRNNPRGFHTYFGIWSIRFSGDGREIVAGTGDNSVYVYDIERRESVLRIPGHDDDVNAVCFGDSQSPHILYSGSDDTTIKVWDRRSMGDGREAGVFLGHTEGLTYVDSKGDGRYVLSNAKDQTAKLWDLRKMMSKDKAERVDIKAYTTQFEYRSNSFDYSLWEPHPHDCSLVTFRGHKVLKTLIRCHFSPPGSTDSRYVYSGSADGSVYIWNMDATPAGKVDVLAATKNSRPRDPAMLDDTYDFFGRHGGSWMTCVRDASWHPSAPVIAATSWNGWGTSQGTCTVHSWNDHMDEDEAEPEMGRRVNPQLQHDERLYRSAPSRRRTVFDEEWGDE